ncbi:hypothetical protein NX059_005382 [Plenodomus lindquistii]|nr:hypothetical protein NX059_005382 [Plenodomus lindquistii]
MHFTTLLLPISLALTAAANPAGTPSIPAGHTPARQFGQFGPLERRDDPEVDPEILCGADYKECGPGWCCSAQQNCAGTIEGVPLCKDPSKTFGILGGTEVAMPYDDLEEKVSSMSRVLATMTGGPEAGGAANTAAGTRETGAAVANGLDGFNSKAVLVAGTWGVAAIGGAGFFLM